MAPARKRVPTPTAAELAQAAACFHGKPAVNGRLAAKKQKGNVSQAGFLERFFLAALMGGCEG